MAEQRAPAWHAIDDAFTSYLNANASIHERWLLVQTMATAVLRRSVLGTLNVQPGWRILDIGTGFGAIPIELAAMQPIDAVGIDIDREVLRAAETIRTDVVERGGLIADSRVTFVAGSAHALEQPEPVSTWRRLDFSSNTFPTMPRRRPSWRGWCGQEDWFASSMS